MIHESPEYKLLRLIRTAPLISVQDALLRAPAREIAMFLISLSRDEQIEILAKIPGVKKKTAENELLYQTHIRSTRAQRLEMIENLTRRIHGDNPSAIASYLRPSLRRKQ